MTTSDYTTNQPEHKTCTKCGESFPATREYFHRNGDGLRAYCKACVLESAKRYREENPDKERERCKRWREENPEYAKHYCEENPEKSRESSKRYREENPDKIREIKKRYREENTEKEREYSKRYYEENRDKIRESRRRYYEENPDKARVYKHRRRARIANAPGTHTGDDIRLQVTAQTDKRGRLRCWWCGKVIKGNDYHVDHRIPLVKGGSNAPNNLCISCPVCNLSKNDKLPHEWNGRLL